jgi:hypothetical protein
MPLSGGETLHENHFDISNVGNPSNKALLSFVNVVISLMMTKFSLIWSATVSKFYIMWNQTINIRINPERFYCFNQEMPGSKMADFHQSLPRLSRPPSGGPL